ncbi:phosphoenolpyruvate carboxykinase (ATP) [soil metagenome]
METMTAMQPAAALKNIGIRNAKIHYQLPAEVLTEQTLLRHQGQLNNTGALCVNTGRFTGRSPRDKFIVKDDLTTRHVNWNNFNTSIDETYFSQLHQKLTAYFSSKNEIWVRDCYACADTSYRLKIRVVNEDPWSNLFANNMFIRPEPAELDAFFPEWYVLQAPSFLANPKEDGTRNPHFAIISFTHKTILIGGTGYTGEMKKGIFTVLNYLLPQLHEVLSMHCSANIGTKGDTAIFFGLSGTGKTTLSADPQRQLIGDDEHGWNENGVFNFEGGCYAKCIDLSKEKEPEIFNAIRPGALIENVQFFDGTSTIDFASKAITENTRVSYPLDFISNSVEPSHGPHPKNIFFLTCDANGVFPPISKLTPGQAMYQFISGYTAKVAGTETGITEPKSTFSACFGAPFMPLHPGCYAQMLGDKIKKYDVNVWLVNTGWSGGAYGTGSRMKLSYTRALIAAALNGELEKVGFGIDPVFGFAMPDSCPGVPSEILNPKNTWSDKEAYDTRAKALASEFVENFNNYSSCVNVEILSAAPVI